MTATLFVLAGLFALCAQPATAASGGYKVLFLNGTGGAGCDGDSTVQTGLAAQPGIAKVDPFNASLATPSVAQLEAYDLAVAHDDCDAYADGDALGDNLASYADHGGVVIEYAYSFHTTTSFQIRGRWLSGGYSPLLPGTNVNNNVTLGSFTASSPLMAGVSTLTAGCNTASNLAPGATRVAQWNNAQEAVAFKGQAVAVNASIDDSSCAFSGDYARLTRNAVSLQKPPSGTVISAKKIVKKKRKARFEFSAAGGHVSGFECALARKKGKKKVKKSALTFSACASPKAYKKLKPGKYTFEVRATNATAPDPAPAIAKFKI